MLSTVAIILAVTKIGNLSLEGKAKETEINELKEKIKEAMQARETRINELEKIIRVQKARISELEKKTEEEEVQAREDKIRESERAMQAREAEVSELKEKLASQNKQLEQIEKHKVRPILISREEKAIQMIKLSAVKATEYIANFLARRVCGKAKRPILIAERKEIAEKIWHANSSGGQSILKQIVAYEYSSKTIGTIVNLLKEFWTIELTVVINGTERTVKLRQISFSVMRCKFSLDGSGGSDYTCISEIHSPVAHEYLFGVYSSQLTLRLVLLTFSWVNFFERPILHDSNSKFVDPFDFSYDRSSDEFDGVVSRIIDYWDLNAWFCMRNKVLKIQSSKLFYEIYEPTVDQDNDSLKLIPYSVMLEDVIKEIPMLCELCVDSRSFFESGCRKIFGNDLEIQPQVIDYQLQLERELIEYTRQLETESNQLKMNQIKLDRRLARQSELEQKEQYLAQKEHKLWEKENSDKREVPKLSAQLRLSQFESCEKSHQCDELSRRLSEQERQNNDLVHQKNALESDRFALHCAFDKERRDKIESMKQLCAIRKTLSIICTCIIAAIALIAVTYLLLGNLSFGCILPFRGLINYIFTGTIGAFSVLLMVTLIFRINNTYKYSDNGLVNQSCSRIFKPFHEQHDMREQSRLLDEQAI